MVKTADEGIALHTDEFLKFGKSDTAYRGMAAGMKSILMTSVRILMDPDFFKRIKNDFKENTRGL